MDCFSLRATTARRLALALTWATLFAAPSPAEAADENVSPALGGYCPVGVIDAKKWLAGNAGITAEFDGHRYRFASKAARETFLADPVKYVPAFGGDCIVTWKRTGKRVAGKLGLGLFYEDRLFLFASADAREKFRGESGVYGTADLAYEGRSPVSLVEDGTSVRGDQELYVVHRGLRYHFATNEERETFLAEPTHFEVERKKVEVASEEGQVTAVGKSACAYCDYKVWPMLTEGELGLAVEAADGTVYIVEHADTKFVDLYNDRFDGITLSLTGREIKRQGKFVWVVPDSLELGT